jgi:uncharacterized membrane protein
MTRRLLNYFVRGLALTAPIALTVYVVLWVLRKVDGWVPLPIPGLGLLVVVTGIMLVGVLGSSLITRGIVALVDGTLERLPFVRILYGSTRDLLNAFVGERRAFKHAVAVGISGDGAVKAIGFITRDSLDELGLAEHVAVYLPQSYNFAGQLLLVPRSRVTLLPIEGAQAMALIVSGGVSDG